MAIKTAVGMTDRVNIPDTVQQGGTWGSLLCSNTIDTVGKKCRDRNQPATIIRREQKFSLLDSSMT